MSAPSFSSFPPSFASFPDLGTASGQPPSGPSKSGRSEDDSKKREGGKNKKEGKDKKRKHVQNPRKGEIYPVLVNDERLKANEDTKRRAGEDSKSLFYSDRKGDPLNIQYGGLHSGDIPKYHLVGRGRKILGLSLAWTALYRSRKGVEVGVDGRRKIPGLTDSASRALLAAPPMRRIINSGDTYKYAEIDGYLRLPSRRGRNNNEQSYRSITLAKDEADSDSDSGTSESDHGGGPDNSDDDYDSDTTPLTSHQATLKSVEQELSADPSSITTWLSLLSHTLSTIPITSKNATKARSEISLSILSRALSADPKNARSKVLHLKYLKAGEDVWHESKVRAEWEDALKVGEVDIWMEWLEWRIRRGNKGIDGVVEDAKRVLDVLGADEEDEIGKVRVFWRVAVAFQNAGFVERATAVFQAQSELTFEVPQALYGLPLETRLDALEEFWESEAPRVGEAGAKGWAAWVSSGRPEHLSASSAPYSQDGDIEMSDPYRQWYLQETRSDRTCHLPTRSTADTEITNPDPYAMILFSDLRDLLFGLQSQRAKNAFRFAWLSFLGLHIPGFSASLSPKSENWDDRWCFKHLTSPTYISRIFPAEATQRRMMADAVVGVLIGREKEYSSSFGPVKSWGYGVFAPLNATGEDTEGLGKGTPGGRMWGKEDTEVVDVGFVRRVFEQLRLGVEDFEWDNFALAFEATLNVKSALKLSRAFLSIARDSLPHWAAHAQLERLRGRANDARKVYQTVLVSPLSVTGTSTSQLWWDWAEMEWLAENSDGALQVVFRATGVEGKSGIALLRAKRSLEDVFREVGADASRWKAREALIKLRALLELLTGNEPASALFVFDEHLFGDEILSGSVAHESLTVACLLMLYRHGVILKNPIPPSILRERVEKAMEVYPSNTAILGMFLEGEKGRGIWGKVRGILGESGGKDKDVARRVMEVWIAGWETGRWKGEVERTRSGLAGSIEDERTRGSPILWRIYIEFEIRAGQLQRAKKMLFRAIGECPLVKELYLLAFGPLRGVFSPRELNAFGDTMAERGLRMRKGVDEMIEGWADDEEKNEESGDSGDEIEQNAKELRRLMPY